MRTNYQVLVIPFRRKDDIVEYCIFKREDMNIWQGVAGGGEGEEKPIAAAAREFYEEAGIKADKMIALDSTATIPSYHFKDAATWGEDLFVVKEYAFTVETTDKDEVKISNEHLEHKWVTYEEALELLEWDSNKNALWEINERIKKGKIYN